MPATAAAATAVLAPAAGGEPAQPPPPLAPSHCDFQSVAHCCTMQASCETHPPRAADLEGLHGLQKTRKERGAALLLLLLLLLYFQRAQLGCCWCWSRRARQVRQHERTACR